MNKHYRPLSSALLFLFVLTIEFRTLKSIPQISHSTWILPDSYFIASTTKADDLYYIFMHGSIICICIYSYNTH